MRVLNFKFSHASLTQLSLFYVVSDKAQYAAREIHGTI